MSMDLEGKTEEQMRELLADEMEKDGAPVYYVKEIRDNKNEYFKHKFEVWDTLINTFGYTHTARNKENKS